MSKLPPALAAALTEERFGDAADAVAKALRTGAAWLPADQSYEFILWALLGTVDHGLPLVSTAARNPSHPLKASPERARAALLAFLPAVVPTVAERETDHKRLWDAVGRWAHTNQKQHIDPAAIGAVCADALLTALPLLDRKPASQALDLLATALRPAAEVREAFFERLTQPDALTALAAAKVALKPADLVVVEVFRIGGDELRLEPAAERADALQQQQEARLTRVLDHPAGADRLLRLDLNPVGPFEALLNGAYATPARAAWVGQKLLPLLRAKGKAQAADRLASLLDEPVLQDLLARADQVGIESFFEKRPHFIPARGWPAVLDAALTSSVAHAWRALVRPHLPTEQRVAVTKDSAAFADALIAHTLPNVGAERAAQAVRMAMQRWKSLSGDTIFAHDVFDTARTLAPDGRAALMAQLKLMFANPLVDTLRAALGRLTPEHPEALNAAQLLVALLETGFTPLSLPESQSEHKIPRRARP